MHTEWVVFFKAELTAVGCFPPVTDYNPQAGAGFGIAAQSDTQALLQTAATVTRSENASLEMRKVSFEKESSLLCKWHLIA